MSTHTILCMNMCRLFVDMDISTLKRNTIKPDTGRHF